MKASAEMSVHLKTSFPAIEPPKARVLILGSIPGDRSIAENQYYGHPRNRFWKMLAYLTGSETPDDYSAKKELLYANQITLWDVAQQAIRKGSMDSDIKNAVPNDIRELLERNPGIKTIGFNGKKAEALFDKFFEREKGMTYRSLPSTSPANAGITFDSLCGQWAVLFSG